MLKSKPGPLHHDWMLDTSFHSHNPTSKSSFRPLLGAPRAAEEDGGCHRPVAGELQSQACHGGLRVLGAELRRLCERHRRPGARFAALFGALLQQEALIPIKELPQKFLQEAREKGIQMISLRISL